MGGDREVDEMSIQTMIQQRLARRAAETVTERVSSLDLRSGPGAPMFELGAQTRIRRAPVRAIASFTWAEGPRQAYGQVCNLSPGGCLLKTETTIPVGADLTLNVVLVGDGNRHKAELTGVVRRRTTSDDGRIAYGLEFTPADREERQTIEWLYGQALG